MVWSQGYDPLGNAFLSTLVAALPVLVLLGSLAIFRLKAHNAALLGLGTAVLAALFVFGLPASAAFSAVIYGAAFGFLPIGWIVLNALFLYNLTNDKGFFKVLRESISTITPDRRLQVLLVAFSFGAFMEGGAGFGAPVAVASAMLLGLGFPPLTAASMAMIGNTVPVTFGSLGVPIISLQTVTQLDMLALSRQAGLILAPFCLLMPFVLIAVFAGFAGMMEIWPALLVVGVSYSIPQVLISSYHGPWLVCIASAIISMSCLVMFLRVWHPKQIWLSTGRDRHAETEKVAIHSHGSGEVMRAWTPWIILTVILLAWGLPQITQLLGKTTIPIQVPNLHNLVQRVPPAVPAPRLEAAVFNFNYLTTPGTAILFAAIIGGLFMGCSFGELGQVYVKTLKGVKFALLTISTMVAIGYTTRYAGLDATMGLAFAKTGVFYPAFGAILGWVGVASTGSDSSANILFGSLQRLTAEKLGLSPVLMAGANTTGGVMGKMIAGPSAVVACTATNWPGHEGEILRSVFFYSAMLTIVIGIWMMLIAYVYPFTNLIVN